MAVARTRDNLVIAIYDQSFRSSLEPTVLEKFRTRYVGHGLLSDAGFTTDVDSEHERLRSLLDGAYMLVVAVTGESREEVRAIAAAQEKGVPCAIIVRMKDLWKWEALPHLCSKYAFVCCIVGPQGCAPDMGRIFPYPVETAYSYSLAKSGDQIALTMEICANFAKKYGSDVPAIHERDREPQLPLCSTS